MMPTTIPSYCTPFFHRCKYFFAKFLNYLQKIFQRPEKQGHQLPDSLPKQGDGPPQKPACGQLPGQSPQGQGGGSTQPDVTPADAEAQLQPGPKGGDHENQVRRDGPTPAQGSQRSVEDAQTHTQPQSLDELQGGLGRGGHPNRRRRMPPLLRGSS